MKHCLNLIGAIALLVAFGSCCAFFAVVASTDTEGKNPDEINNEAIPVYQYICVFAGGLLLSFSLFLVTKSMSRREKEARIERRHQEQIDAVYLAASMQAQANRPAAVNEDDLMIERAKRLYQQGDIEGCKALLRTMPNNPKALKALARIEGR